MSKILYAPITPPPRLTFFADYNNEHNQPGGNVDLAQTLGKRKYKSLRRYIWALDMILTRKTDRL